ncbi:MAG: tyrosine-type recombinase/integrase [Sphingobacteriia bacterium]|nr:tyrosine-type recombinase/integrase [Sphingobacteriia bacterium]
MNENKKNFTINELNKLSLPEAGKRAYYYDSKLNGLGIMIFPSGTKTFFVYKRVNGKPDKIKLGRFPDMSIEQARKAATSCLNDISQGIDPNKDKKKLRNEMLFSELFSKYLEEYAKKRKKSWHIDKGYYDNHLEILYKKKISSILKQDIEKLHHLIKERAGLYAANRTISLIQTVYNKAIDWGYEGLNPALRIKKFKENARDRFLKPDEISSFFEAINNEPNDVIKAFFYISLFTGARKSNVLSMQWKDLHLDSDPYWKIPETKNGEAHIVSLVPEAVDILKELKDNSDSKWVFPSPASKSGHLEEPKSAWKRILKRAGIEDLRIHDLRRTMASWQVRNGANSYIIGKTLGHKDKQATAVYARVSADTARESMEKAVKDMINIITKS